MAGIPGIGHNCKIIDEISTLEDRLNFKSSQLFNIQHSSFLGSENTVADHICKVMRSRELSATELPVAKTYLEAYLKTAPSPAIPLQAYTRGLMVLCEKFLGNQEQAEKLQKEATAMDPYFSRASGIPTLLLFDPPDQMPHKYFSFFSPF